MIQMPGQEFSYQWYEQLLLLCKDEGYQFCGYEDWADKDKAIILRHDIDYVLERALPIAKLEAKHGVKSTYFILLRGSYNVFSERGYSIVKTLSALGHDIGLHFDETLYSGNDWASYITKEVSILEELIGVKIRSVSMHRPSKKALNENWLIPNVQNAYSETYFKNFKYVSDSRMHWREDPVAVITSGKHSKLQVLTHPFWYREESLTLCSMLNEFIDSAPYERTLELYDNFSNLEEIIGKNKIRRAQTAIVLNKERMQTERLLLRPLCMSDANDMHEYTSDSQVCKFLSWGPYSNIKQVKDWLAAKLSKTNPDDVLLGIEELESSRLIGVIRIYNIDKPKNSAEISYILNPTFQGRGYMNEACKAALRIGFDWLDVSTMYACVDEDNRASIRVLERLGMKNVENLAFQIVVKGSPRKYKKFAIEKSEIVYE